MIAECEEYAAALSWRRDGIGCMKRVKCTKKRHAEERNYKIYCGVYNVNNNVPCKPIGYKIHWYLYLSLMNTEKLVQIYFQNQP